MFFMYIHIHTVKRKAIYVCTYIIYIYIYTARIVAYYTDACMRFSRNSMVNK